MRKTRLYCIGAAKTGTHSIAGMFDGSVRSYHEPDNIEMMHHILDRASGKTSKVELSTFIRDRDTRLRADVDSSQLNNEIIDILLEEFPDALFILTIRDCYSWLNSFINHCLNNPNPKELRLRYREHRFRTERREFPPEERILEELGFEPMRGYFNFWTRHNTRAIDMVPDDRLMIVRTDQIADRAIEIADFARLPHTALRLENAHEFKTPKNHRVLRKIPEGYIEAMAEECCGPLMGSIFPDIRSLDDAGL
jgi:hypothetical protein